MICSNVGCFSQAMKDHPLCTTCLTAHDIALHQSEGVINRSDRRERDIPMSQRYPKYYKQIPEGVKELDVYGVCAMFPVQDDTGCINHARKKLLVPGTRTGGKSLYNDIKEARDTLNRWLELNKETS